MHPLSVMPPDASHEGWRVDDLLAVTAWLTGGYLALVAVALAWLVVRYRARAGHAATPERGDARRDAALTLVVAASVFVLVDAGVVWQSGRDLRARVWAFPRGPGVVRVEVLAQQFAWNVRHAGPDGRFATADDVVTVNDLRVPVGRPVVVQLRAKDVIHSFFLPHFRVKQDAIPGATTRAWFRPAREGTYEVACAELCGWGHYAMRGELRVVAPDAFERWLAARAEDARDPAATRWGWDWEGAR